MPKMVNIATLLILCAILSLVFAAVSSTGASANNIALANLHYNYIVDVTVDNQTLSGLIVDTGNPSMTVFSRNTTIPYSSKKTSCTMLYEDDTEVYFYSKIGTSTTECYIIHNKSATLGTSTILDSYTAYQLFYAANPKLHNWNESLGDIGLAYAYSGKEIPLPFTSFQTFLSELPEYEYSSSLPSSQYIFGLDFNVNGRNDSSMQLGFVSPQYKDNITWMVQPTETPIYHTFFIDNLEFCGVSLFGNYSSNWPVLVDTGSVCLTLPGEFYDTFFTWFDRSGAHSVDDLPVLSFSLFSSNSEKSSDQIYINLESLLVNSTVFMKETYPSFTSETGFCVLRGQEIGNLNGKSLNQPYIVFGTQVLHSFYFAADFQNKVVGLAIKNSSQIYDVKLNTPGQGMCASRTLCKGSQLYSPESNTCADPDCHNYFFMEMNDSSKTCEFTSGAIFVGFLFLVTVSIFEAFHYFVLQYTSYELIDRNQDANSFILSKLNPVSIFIGRYLTKFIDFLVVKVLKCNDTPERRHRNNIEGENQFNQQELAPLQNEEDFEDIGAINNAGDRDETAASGGGGGRSGGGGGRGVAVGGGGNNNNTNGSTAQGHRRIQVLTDDEDDDDVSPPNRRSKQYNN